MVRTLIGRPTWLATLALAVCLLSLLSSGIAHAHPLGNFTINQYSELRFGPETARLDYVLDFAEIPTMQRMRRLDGDGDGELSQAEARRYLDAEAPTLVRGLLLRVGNAAVPLRVLERSAQLLPGEAALRILRIELRLEGALPSGWENAAGSYRNANFDDRLGWREIVASGGRGVVLRESSAATASVSDRLRAYPQDSLASPLDQRQATFTLAAGSGVSPADASNRAAAGVRESTNEGREMDRVTALFSAERLTPGTIALALLAALLWGATHALSPGHGKAVVAAYLIGARGTARHAAFLGLTVTATHTAGIFALGLVTLYLSRYLLPEDLYPWLSVVSGALVVAIGVSLLLRRVRDIRAPAAAAAAHAHGSHPHGHGHHHDHDHDHAHDHEHAHGHDHDHDHVHDHAHGHEHAPDDHHHAHGDVDQAHRHVGGATALARAEHTADHAQGPLHGQVHTHDGHTHSHLPPGADGSKITTRGLLALGISGGLVPCPSALVLLLGAISLGRVGLGIVLVIAFSLGLAAVLTGIGLALVYLRHVFERFSFEVRSPRYLPVASALAISLAGVVILIGALRQVGMV